MSEEAEAEILDEIANVAQGGMMETVVPDPVTKSAQETAEKNHAVPNDENFDDPGTPLGDEYQPPEDSEEEDDIQITIGDIRANVTTFRPQGVNAQRGLVVGGAGGGAGKQAQKLDLDATADVNGTSIYDLDLFSLDEKPWRKPGADLTDYFNYGFTEETWLTYCDRQKKLRSEYGDTGAVSNKILFSSMISQFGGVNTTNLASNMNLHMDKNAHTQRIQPISQHTSNNRVTELPIIMRTVLVPPKSASPPPKQAVVLTPAVPTPATQFSMPPPDLTKEPPSMSNMLIQPLPKTVPSLASNVSMSQALLQNMQQQSMDQFGSSPPVSPGNTPPPNDEFGGDMPPTLASSSAMTSASSATTAPPPPTLSSSIISGPSPTTADLQQHHPPPVMSSAGGGGPMPPMSVGGMSLPPTSSSATVDVSGPPPTTTVTMAMPPPGSEQQPLHFPDMSIPPPRFPPTNLPPPGFGPPPPGMIAVPGMPPTNVPPPMFPPGAMPPPGVPMRFPPPFGFPPPVGVGPRVPPPFGRETYVGFNMPGREEARSPASYSDKSSDEESSSRRDRYESGGGGGGGGDRGMSHYRGGGGRHPGHPMMNFRHRSMSRGGPPPGYGRERERSSIRASRPRSRSRDRSRHRDERRTRERSEYRERSKHKRSGEDDEEKVKKHKIKEEVMDDESPEKTSKKSKEKKERSGKKKKKKERHNEDEDGEDDA